MMTSFNKKGLKPSKTMRFGGVPSVDVERALRPADSDASSVINKVSWFEATNIPSVCNEGIAFNGCQKWIAEAALLLITVLETTLSCLRSM